MTTKLQNYIQLAGQTAAQVTKTPIGLVGVNRSGYPKLRYVFDIADTGKKDESSSLFQWQYKEEYRGIVIKALEEQFGVSGEKGLLYQLEMIAVKLANDYWKYYHKDLVYECEGSFLEGLEESAVSVKFRLAAAASISYVLLARCGYDPWKYLKSKDFRDIPDFNTQRIIKILGVAVSESSEQVLRTIAVTIYHHEYQKQTVPNTSRSVQPYRDGDDIQPTKAPEQEDNTKAPEPVTDVTTDTEEPVPADTEVVPDKAYEQKISVPVPRNFIITDDRLGEGGPKTKFRMNMEAIRTLKKIESESRTATPDEQQVLSKYVGWGGIPDAFEPDKAGWEKEYQELNAVLTPEEYASARTSVLNAHYTSPAVIKAMYQAVGDMGFTSGNILEPSCAVGNFFGLRQDSRTISLTLPLATCRSGSIRSTTRNIISWASPFTTIFLPNLSIKCVPAAFLHLSPHVTQWIPRIQM